MKYYLIKTHVHCIVFIYIALNVLFLRKRMLASVFYVIYFYKYSSKIVVVHLHKNDIFQAVNRKLYVQSTRHITA